MQIVMKGKTSIAIYSDLKGDSFMLLSKLPGRSRWVGRTLIASTCSENLQYLEREFPTALWDAEAKRVLVEDQEKRKKAAENSAKKKEGLDKLFLEDCFLYKTVPLKHQREAFMLSRDMEAFGLLHEQGCGKTKVLIDNSAYLFQEDKIDALIIIAPNGVHRNWIEEEIPKHMALPGYQYVSRFYSSSLSKRDLAELREEFENTPKDKLVIAAFNIDGFSSDKAVDLLNWCLKTRRCMVVIDESSRIKNPQAIRTKYLTKIGKKALYRRIASGTPITKGPENYFSQLRFLDPQILGLDSFTAFKSEYCEMGGFEQRNIIGYKNLDKLIAKVDGYCHRVLKKDVLDLPDKIYKRFPFELSPSQRKIYNDIARESYAELGENTMSTEMAVTRLLRLQQVTRNWFAGDNFQSIGHHNPALQALKEIIEDTDGKIIIYSNFVADLEMITAALGREAVLYRGNDSQKALAKKRFLNEDKIRFFIGHQHSAGIGLTLTVANNIIYYSNNFNLEDRLQSEDRAHRIGQRSNVNITDLTAVRTVDEKIIKALREKKDIADLVNQDPQSLFMDCA